MKTALRETQRTFVSASGKTPEYVKWHRCFKKEFINFLTSQGAKDINIAQINHFDISGFFKIGEQTWYFRIEDVRWSKETMLIRTAQNDKDYTGGRNQYISLTRGEQFFTDCFQTITKPIKIIPLVIFS